MLRQNSLQPNGMGGRKTEAECLDEAADIESLRAAYLAVAGQPGRVVSGKLIKNALHPASKASNPVPVQMPGQNHVQHAGRIPSQSPNLGQMPVSRSVPVQANNGISARPIGPVDAALLAIAEVESQTGDRTPRTSRSHAVNHTSIEQALQRNQEFSGSNSSPRRQSVNSQMAATSTRQPEAMKSAEAIRQTPGTQPAAVKPASGQQPVKNSNPVQMTAPTGTTLGSRQGTQAVDGTAGASQPTATNRAVKLPKFLVAPEAEHYAPAKSAPTANGNGSFNPLGNPLPAVPQNLFSDLKPASMGNAETVKTLSQTVHSATTNNAKNTDNPVEQFFDTASGANGKNANQASFIDFLATQPETAQKAVGDVPVENGEEWVERYQRYESTWVKLFERPRLLLGVLGLGIVSCSVYIALGYWWFGGGPTSQAAETVNLLNVEDSSSVDGSDPTTTFNNIHSIQNGAHWTKKLKNKDSSKPEGVLLAQAAPAATGGLSGEPAASSDAEPIKYEPVGRPDPFSPLVSNGSDASSGKEDETQKKKDILTDLQYTGFIGDISSRDKVAIIRVNDSVTGSSKTQIKKVGESFVVDGELVVLRGISKKALLVSAQGETRQLPIQQYQALKPQPQTPGAAPDSAGGAAGPAGVPGGPGGGYGGPAPGGAAGMMKGLGGNPANVSLSEPRS